MKKLIKENWKHYAVSSLITFVAGFAVAVLPLLDNLTLDSLESGVLVGVFLTGVRAGLKVLIESFVVWYSKK